MSEDLPRHPLTRRLLAPHRAARAASCGPSRPRAVDELLGPPEVGGALGRHIEPFDVQNLGDLVEVHVALLPLDGQHLQLLLELVRVHVVDLVPDAVVLEIILAVQQIDR